MLATQVKSRRRGFNMTFTLGNRYVWELASGYIAKWTPYNHALPVITYMHTLKLAEHYEKRWLRLNSHYRNVMVSNNLQLFVHDR